MTNKDLKKPEGKATTTEILSSTDKVATVVSPKKNSSYFPSKKDKNIR